MQRRFNASAVENVALKVGEGASLAVEEASGHRLGVESSREEVAGGDTREVGAHSHQR